MKENITAIEQWYSSTANPTYRVLMPRNQPQPEQRCTEKWTCVDCGAEPSPAKIIISHRILDNEQKIGIFQQSQWFVK